MKDTATYTAWAPKGGPANVRFEAEGLMPGRPYRLEVTDPDGSRHVIPITGNRTIAFTTTMPRGTSTFRLLSSGTPARQVSPTDLREVTIRVSQWSIS